MVDATIPVPMRPEQTQARDEMEAALAAGHIADYCGFEDHFEDLLLDDAMELMIGGDFAAGAVLFDELQRLNEQLVAVVSAVAVAAAAGDGDEPDPIAKARERGPRLRPQWTGFRDYATGQALRLAGRFEEAAAQFESAAREWTAADYDPDLIQRSKATVTMCQGMERMRRADFTQAAAAFQAARVRFDQISRPPAPSDDDGAAQTAPTDAEFDAMTCELLYRLTASRGSLTSGNLDAAVNHADAMCAVAKRIIDKRPADAPAWVRASANGDLHIGEGWRAAARAERFRRDSKWSEAIAAYTQAQAEFEMAAAEYVSTGLPQAVANQEQLLNQAAILNLTIRQTEDQREGQQQLLQRIEELERTLDNRDGDVAELVQALRGQGVNITTIAEAKAQVDVNVKIVQQVETHVREQLQELRRAVAEDGGVDDQTRQVIVGQVDKTLADAEHGPGFLRRAGMVAEQLGEATKAAGIIAGPIPVLIGSLVSLVGRWARGERGQ